MATLAERECVPSPPRWTRSGQAAEMLSLTALSSGGMSFIGGFQSSMDVAQRAGIEAGVHGVDLCCCKV
jgi:hypothetical protein